jgi:flagellar biosynthetic protein FliR
MDITTTFMAILLAFARITAFLFIVPVFRQSSIPAISKITIGVALSFASLSKMPELDIHSMPSFALALLIQVAIGITLGYIVEVIISAASMAGGIMDMDIGFSMAMMMDPATKQNSSVLQVLLSTLYYVIFLATGGFNALMTTIVASMKFIQPTAYFGNQSFMDYILSVVLYMLTAAVQISLPLTATMFILNIIMLVIGKSSPKLNIFMNGIGIKIGVGILMLCMVMPFVGQVFISMNEVLLDKFNDALMEMFKAG